MLQSEGKSDSGIEEVSGTDEDSDSDSESGMKLSDDENTFSLCLLSRSSRLRSWHKGALRFKQLQFQSNSCGISAQLNDTDSFKSATEYPRKQCVVCFNTTGRTKKTVESRYECAEHDVYFCISGCFRNAHVLKYF